MLDIRSTAVISNSGTGVQMDTSSEGVQMDTSEDNTVMSSQTNGPSNQIKVDEVENQLTHNPSTDGLPKLSCWHCYSLFVKDVTVSHLDKV